MGLHASFTVSDETLRAAASLAQELGAVTHVHVAEDAADVDDARRRGYAGPLQRLLHLEALPQGSILAHGVHLTVDEVKAAEDHGLWLVQNPRSNRGNGVGYAGALRASRRVALGTDGFPARMSEENATLVDEATAHGDDLGAAQRRLAAGRDLLAERFGVSFALEVGSAADLVAFEGTRRATSWSAAGSWCATGACSLPTSTGFAPKPLPRRRVCGRAWPRCREAEGAEARARDKDRRSRRSRADRSALPRSGDPPADVRAARGSFAHPRSARERCRLGRLRRSGRAESLPRALVQRSGRPPRRRAAASRSAFVAHGRGRAHPRGARRSVPDDSRPQAAGGIRLSRPAARHGAVRSGNASRDLAVDGQLLPRGCGDRGSLGCAAWPCCRRA